MLIAGVDIGNTTTEIVIVDSESNPPILRLTDSILTRGVKGSPESLKVAADLLHRMERTLAGEVNLVAIAPHFPVDTRLATLAEKLPETGRLQVLRSSGHTYGGQGMAVGVPIRGTNAPTLLLEPMVLLFPANTGYKRIVTLVKAWQALGNNVVALLIADDEGVLVAARIDLKVPVMDQIDLTNVSNAQMVAIEIRAAGRALGDLADPIKVSNIFNLTQPERKDALAAADTLNGYSQAVIALHERPIAQLQSPNISVLLKDSEVETSLDISTLSSSPVGTVRRCSVANATVKLPTEVDDLWAISLSETAASVANRAVAGSSRQLVIATLRARPPIERPDLFFAEISGRETRLMSSEASAARFGALTTPGVNSDALVIDLGGGTIDLISAKRSKVIAAGAGEMLTAAIAVLLELPRGAAEWIKRGPSSRVEAPQILLTENNLRSFTERPLPSSTIGALVAPGLTGLLPFATTLAPSEWRALRLRIKERVIVDNVRRALLTLDDKSDELLLVGGAAADEEVMGLLTAALPGYSIGRGNIAGSLQNRFAVAYGLALLAI